VGEFRRFIEVTSYRTQAEQDDRALVWNRRAPEGKSDANWRNPCMDQDERHPVVCIVWNDAKAYCKWLSKQTGRLTVYLPKLSGSMPAGLAVTRPSAFMTRNRSSTDAWYRHNTGDGPWPVGKKLANAWQLHDMHGNFWEWCEDWFGRYSEGSEQDPSGPESGSGCVVRGGACNRHSGICRSAVRDWRYPSIHSNYLGFRLLGTSSLHSYPYYPRRRAARAIRTGPAVLVR